MADTFYSLEEAAEKLNKTQDELKQMVKDGKLREFRDGPNILFKVDEVETLMSEIGFAEADDTVVPETTQAEEPSEEPVLEPLESPEEEAEADDLLLSDSETPTDLGDLSNADTALTSQGTSVLGKTDRDYELTDDTMAETALPAGSSSEVPLEEIEEDVNLDSFGSGSGLLDLSLQADDTSLGGILDEIYTAEGEGPESEEAVPAGEIAPEPEQMMPEEPVAAAQPEQEIPAFAQPLVVALPDKQSKILGLLMIVPLVFVFYTIVVAVAGLKGVAPSVLTAVQGVIWYIVVVGVAVTGLTAGAGFVFTGERKTSAKKEKPKKEKKPKEKKPKEKKPKKEKKKKEKKKKK